MRTKIYHFFFPSYDILRMNKKFVRSKGFDFIPSNISILEMIVLAQP